MFPSFLLAFTRGVEQDKTCRKAKGQPLNLQAGAWLLLSEQPAKSTSLSESPVWDEVLCPSWYSSNRKGNEVEGGFPRSRARGSFHRPHTLWGSTEKAAESSEVPRRAWKC